MQPGSQLAHYQIVEKIGEGGIGRVYKVRDLKLERFLAWKVLPVARAEHHGQPTPPAWGTPRLLS